MTIYTCYPGGRHKALTLSYDDGRSADRRLVEICNRHGLRASFHLNGGLLGGEDRIPASEVASLYQGHEVSAHTLTHPTIARCPLPQVARQILEDRAILEGLTGYTVRGMSYPNGSFSPDIQKLLPSLGIEYARVVGGTGQFGLPADPLAWMSTCHHKTDLMQRIREFRALAKTQYLYLMYVWGHSYEFDNDKNWPLIEEFAETAGGQADTWYATNIEIIDYLGAARRIRYAESGAFAENPNAIPVWISAGGRIIELAPGTTTRLI